MAVTDQGTHVSNSSECILTLAKGTAFSFCGQIGQVVISYAYGIVIARFMGVSNYGIFFLGITIFNFLTMVSICGVEDGLMRFLGQYIPRGEKDKAKTVIRFSLLLAVSLGVLLGCICFLSADILAKKLFHKPELADVLRYLSPAIPIFAIMTVSVASIRGFKIVMPYVLVRKIFLPLISFLLAIGVLFMGCGLRGLSIAYTLALICSAALAIFLLMSFLSKFNKEKTTTPKLYRYFSFVISAFLVNIFFFLFNWSDLIILGVFGHSQDLGIYFAAKKTALMLSFLLIALNTIFVPVISHLYNGKEYTQLDHAFKSSIQWMLMLGLPIFLIMIFFSNEILSLFGPEFKEGSMCLIILAFAHLFNISVGSTGYLLMMTNHQKWMVFNSIVFVILAVTLTIVLVPHYGMIGAAYANCAAVIFANLVTLIEVYFLLRLQPFNTRYFKILCSGAITAAVTYIVKLYIPDNGHLIFSFLQAVFVVAIFFVFLILFGLEEDERKFLLAIREKLIPCYIEENAGG